MSDRTPTEEEIEEAWASRYDGENTSAAGEERAGYYAEFRRWLANHDREVKAKAWGEGAAAAWFESGVLQYGDDYPRDNPSWLPFSIWKTNPYTEES